MEQPKYGAPCSGTPCDTIGLPRDSHCHMPPQETLPNRLIVDQEVVDMAAQLLRYSYDGRLGDEDSAWEAVELERLNRELERMGEVVLVAASAVLTEVS